MIFCLSLNPAIDKRLSLERLHPGRVNRATKAQPEPGGKAAHVAMVLRTLGEEPVWIGLIGGAAGSSLVESLRASFIQTETVGISQSTRTNLEILGEDGEVTEILEPGPWVTESELESFLQLFESAVRKAAGRTTIVLSGSLPDNVPEDYYSTLTGIAQKHRCRVFLDSSGEPLRLGLRAGPDLVKSNQQEAQLLSGSEIRNPQQARVALDKILGGGAKAGAISLGGHGMVYRAQDDPETLFASVPLLKVRSAVGSGDAAMAGFAFAAAHGWSATESLRLAAACGTANCLAESPGRARSKDIQRLKTEIQVQSL